MKKLLLFSVMVLSLTVVFPLIASADESPEMIAEKMAVKLGRGTTNFFTCIGEIPKQTVLTSREMGAVGYVIGPLKGVGLTLYRGLIGMTEVIFFMVPQPGYYDPMMEPTYVWQGWEPKRDTTQPVADEIK